MLRNYFIPKSWMISTTARKVYRVAAVFSAGLIPLLFAYPFLSDVDPVSSPWVEPTLQTALLLTVLGAGTTVVAMEYFFFGFDNSPGWKKVFWFVVLVVLGLGPALYCFVAYSRSPYFRRDTPGPEQIPTPLA